MSVFETRPGFWETFAQNSSNALERYEQMKQEKRLRALQKLKFITENSDVGSPIDASTQKDIADYAPEGQSMIKDGAYTGSPEQQRAAEFRQFIESHPDADPETIMTRGAATGAVPAGTYGSFVSGQAARAQRADEFQLRQQQQREMQEDRQQHAMTMANMVASLRGGGDGGSIYGTKADTQKWAANRKQYSPYGGPYNYITQNLLNDPKLAKEELGGLYREGEDIDINSAEPWEKYLAYLNQNQTGIRDEYGMKPEEVKALLDHVTVIKNKNFRKNKPVSK